MWLDKPYPLLAHLLDTAASSQAVIDLVLPTGMASAVAEPMGATETEWAQAVKVLAGWHDCGKTSAAFQNQVRDACPTWLVGHRDAPGAGRHDHVGGLLAYDRLAAQTNARCRYRLAQLIGGHHGTIPKLNKAEMEAYGGSALVDSSPPTELAQARTELWGYLDLCLGAMPDFQRMPLVSASPTLAAVVLADWLASDASFISAQAEEIDGGGHIDCESHYERAYDLAAGLISGSGLRAAPVRSAPTPEVMFGKDDKQWRALQASINQGFAPTGPGIVVICAPTGEGKTEAALIAAHKFAEASGRYGMYFAMPTVATAEGLHDRLGSYLDRAQASESRGPLLRVHSQAILYDAPDSDDGPVSDDFSAARSACRWMRGTRKTILAPFGIGTVDQILLGAMKAKHSPMRVLGAALGCVIVDEAHALDPYMRRLLTRTLEWLAALGTPVIVLSATMPSNRIAELLAAYRKGASGGETDEDGMPTTCGYPMWAAWTTTDGPRSDNSITPARSWDFRFTTCPIQGSDIADRMAEEAVNAAATDGGQTVLLVRSTVAAAQETYNRIRDLDTSLEPGATIDILHSRMPQGIRKQRTEWLLRHLGPDSVRRPRKLILVATQVVEQSLDVCFDYLVTDPAPMSALLQRAGRIRRHRPLPDGQPVPVTVFWPNLADGQWRRSSPIYAKADLIAAHHALTRDNSSLTIRIPDEVPEIIEKTDPETTDQLDYGPDDIEEAEGAVLARLVSGNQDASQAENWSIPHPWDTKPLDTLTGSTDLDGDSPGTRLGTMTQMVLPAAHTDRGWRLLDSTVIQADPDRPPPLHVIRAAFDAAIPVSHPHSEWTEPLVTAQLALAGGWDRTPLAGALILPDGKTDSEHHELAVNSETGLRLTRKGRR